MLSGLRFRGWIVMSFIAVFLFIAVAVPAVYTPRRSWCTAYIGAVTPVLWITYNAALYFILYRPMVQCARAFQDGVCCETDSTGGTHNVTLLTKEMYQLNAIVHALKCETAEMKATTALINRQLDGQLDEDLPQKHADISIAAPMPEVRLS
ncbi:hypothetical protein LSCM1_00936 [Leishmania martiniquensis]|uniref:Uncharacterized protein n=1 Tax=Leishmania martiniquensis TaxID=1580590 RepID=A0A836K847_9TRYP|nr:hypothetical protein LSCM1_00936 [Leishmania martiniquensis]